MTRSSAPSSGQAAPEPSLAQFLAARARRASDARLAIDVGVGLFVLIGASIWRGSGWLVVATASLVVLSYGAWGIADRELEERAGKGQRVTPLRVGRVMSAVVGVLAAVGFALSAMAVILGPVKS